MGLTQDFSDAVIHGSHVITDVTTGLAAEVTPMTQGEALYLQTHPHHLPVLVYAMREANNMAEETGLEGQANGEQDAFRHAFVSARLTQMIGEDNAFMIMYAHEDKPGNPENQKRMDLNNNNVGINIARQFPDASADELARHIRQAIEDGNLTMVVDPVSQDAMTIADLRDLETERSFEQENGPAATMLVQQIADTLDVSFDEALDEVTAQPELAIEIARQKIHSGEISDPSVVEELQGFIAASDAAVSEGAEAMTFAEYRQAQMELEMAASTSIPTIQLPERNGPDNFTI